MWIFKTYALYKFKKVFAIDVEIKNFEKFVDQKEKCGWSSLNGVEVP